MAGFSPHRRFDFKNRRDSSDIETGPLRRDSRQKALMKVKSTDRQRHVRAILFLLATAVCVSIAHAQDREQFRAIQEKVERVVAANLPATVVVTDGRGSGSGVVVSAEGLVLTAGHVMTTGGNDYRVTFPDGRQLKARPLGKNLSVDAAMLMIAEPGPWPYVELGDCDGLKLADWCVCLGHPGGYDLGRVPPVRVGKIIAIKPNQLITDCALIGGDSGGPLFDLDGRLIGIHSSISYDSIAINRHVKINAFRQSWDRMRSGATWGTLPELTNDDDEALRAVPAWVYRWIPPPKAL